MVDQREAFLGARDRSGTHKIVTTHFLAEVSERKVAYSNLQMLLSKAFEEEDTAIKTMWVYFWKEEEEIIRMVFQVFGQ